MTMMRTINNHLKNLRITTTFLVVLLCLHQSPVIQAQEVSIMVVQDCVPPSSSGSNSRLDAGFSIQGDNDELSSYWVGLYRDEAVDRVTSRMALLDGEPELWVMTCGTQECTSRTNRGTITFGPNRPGDWNGIAWPPQEGTHRAVLVNFHEDEGDPEQYVAVAYSDPFEISPQCDDPMETNDMDDVFGGAAPDDEDEDGADVRANDDDSGAATEEPTAETTDEPTEEPIPVDEEGDNPEEEPAPVNEEGDNPEEEVDTTQDDNTDNNNNDGDGGDNAPITDDPTEEPGPVNEEGDNPEEEPDTTQDDNTDNNNNDGDGGDNAPIPGMADVVRNARADIAAVIQSRPILSAMYLRMIFHDCVGGGCDGCINLSNMDNGGLSTAMNSLRDVESTYRSQGLTRADVFVLASYVAVDMTLPNFNAATDQPLIPFLHYGRENCDSSDPSQGPDPELCSPNLGTDDIINFFAQEFGFSARETAAIMGAHTVGVMRRNILGFAGENGWVPDNTRFDNQYYIELVGTGSSQEAQTEGAPQWRQAPVDNSDLSGIPDRFQWEGFPGGRKVVMLNADVAMVRQLDDSNKDPETGEVSCKFVNRAPGDGPRCPVARSDLFDRMVEYSQSNTQFLNDFRDAMIKMTDTGYLVQSSSCDADGMCRLIRN